jgi:hypothetical protein
MVGGAWGLQGTANTLGIRIVAAAVVVLLVAAILVVLARAGSWQQAIVPDRVIRLLTWGLAVFFLGHGAGSGGAWPRLHWPHRTLPSH